VQFFLGKIMMGELHGEVLGQITPYYKNYWNWLFTSFSSIIDYMWNPIFINEESINSWILMLTSLLGGTLYGPKNLPCIPVENSPTL